MVMQVFKENKHIHKKNHVIIVIPAYNGVEEQVLVDKVDFPKVEPYFWKNIGNNHIVTSQVQTPDSSKLDIRFAIIRKVKGYDIKHKNGNMFDYRRKNLILVKRNVKHPNKDQILQPAFITSFEEEGYIEKPINPRYMPSPYKILKKKGYIKVTLLDVNSNVTGYALVSLEDEDKIKDQRWHLVREGKGTCYAKNSQDIRMHIAIMGEKEGYVIDHKNRKGLDNRRENLHFVTNPINTRNQEIQGNVPVMGISYLNNSFYVNLTTDKGKLFVLRTKTLMEAICIKNYLIDRENDTLNKKEDLKYWSKELNENPVRIKSNLDVSRICVSQRDTGINIYGVYIARVNKQILGCSISLEKFNAILQIKRKKDSPINRVRLAYLYNCCVKLIMERFPDEFLPINDIKALCREAGVARKKFDKLKQDWQLRPAILEAIKNLEYKHRNDYDVIRYKGKKTAIVYTNRGRKFFLIDYEDLDKIKHIQWRVMNRGSYVTHRNRMLLHRFIFGLTPINPEVIHHKNGVRWDNRRDNLEITTPHKNSSIKHSQEQIKQLEEKIRDEVKKARKYKKHKTARITVGFAD